MPRMEAPETGVKVRMYRQGHGDCFLLAFPGEDGKPVYMLLDCGYKPGSQVHIDRIDKVVDDIAESTDNHLDVVLITHEHQDHVNGFWNRFFGNDKEYFADIEVDQLWLAWTENPADAFANDLRDRFNDTLMGLMAAQRHLANAPGRRNEHAASWMQRLLEFELGGDENGLGTATPEGLLNKLAIQFIKEKSKSQCYLEPHGPIYSVPKVPDVSVFALGPPRNEELLLSLDPVGAEGFNDAHPFALALEARHFFAAVRELEEGAAIEDMQPFARRYRIPTEEAFGGAYGEFFEERYGAEGNDRSDGYRRIDHDWLHTAERLALRLNDEVNNTSLVVAIELPNSGRVLLFVGDAQRGNWVSWNQGTWTREAAHNGIETISARDLLGRVILYKVGHHGSHNATLKGNADSSHPSLGWFARDTFSDEFVAMLPAHNQWALKKTPPWRHPLPSIEAALLAKAKGRVFRTDEDNLVKDPSLITDGDWDAFQALIVETDLFHEYTIIDE